MKKIRYYLAKIKSKIKHSQEPMINYYRSMGAKIGEKCLICSNILTSESFLIEIGDRVTISTNVTFITHDYSAHNVMPDRSDLFGKIIIGENCFIGSNSIIMLGIELADNIIVAAGSVVTKSFKESNIIIGGNPARKIGTWDGYKQKYYEIATPNSISGKQARKELLKTDKHLVKR